MFKDSDFPVFRVLMHYGSLSLSLCEFASSRNWKYRLDSNSICTAIGVPRSRRAELSRLLKELTKFEFFEQWGHEWSPSPSINFQRWRDRISGALVFKAEYDAINSTEVVLSRPPKPSVFIQRLMNSLKSDWGLLDTESIIPEIAQTAVERAVIVSPFIDDYGIQHVINFFSQTRATNKCLIYRGDKAGVKEALMTAQHELQELNVKTYCYHFPLPEQGNESFHAKILLADRHTALVGSSNMTKWSMRYSLELGIKVRGPAANRVADIIDAMLASCE